MKKQAIIVALAVQLFVGASLAWGATRIASLPMTINTSGEYYLSTNLNSTGNGITINASNVSIDLKGQTISGTGTTGIAISLATGATGINDIEIANGSITGFKSGGVSLLGVESVRVINLRVTNIGTDNTDVYRAMELGDNALIKDCTFAHNKNGVVVQNGSLITGNTVYNSLGNGINASWGNGNTIIGNTVSGGAKGGIAAGMGSTVKNNTVYGNQQEGIYAGPYSLLDGNSAYNNDLSGEGNLNINADPTCVLGINVAP